MTAPKILLGIVLALTGSVALLGCSSSSSKPGLSSGSTATAAPATTTTNDALKIQSVNWPDIEVPGSVCKSAEPIELHAGTATIATPAGLNAGTPQVVISESKVEYGDLNGSGQDDAAVNLWCANTGGTADGQLMDSWVIYTAETGTLGVVGILVPQQPASPNLPHVAYFDTDPGGLAMQPGTITVKEVWYGPNDPTCCPSIMASTKWTFAHGALKATGTTKTS